MAKSKDKDELPTAWTNEEIANLLSEQESTIVELQKRLGTLEEEGKSGASRIVALEAELAAVAPGRSTIPVEIFTGVTAQETFRQALVGSTIAHLFNAPEAAIKNEIYRKKIAERILDFAELIVNTATERYKGKK